MEQKKRGRGPIEKLSPVPHQFVSSQSHRPRRRSNALEGRLPSILSIGPMAQSVSQNPSGRLRRRRKMSYSSRQMLNSRGNMGGSAMGMSTRRKGLPTAGSLNSAQRHQKRLMYMFFTAVQVLCFASAMRRVLRRHREWVRRETIEKPRAVFVIQTAWRANRQRQRITQSAALRILVPFLRVRIHRIMAERERSALFLQRVFRSQRDRHFIHWLYRQMKHNKALNVVRLLLKRYIARRCRLLLERLRDEREVVLERCAMAAQVLVREERAELLHILQTANVSAVTPVITRAMLSADIARTTGHGAGDKKEFGEISCSSALHTPEGAWQFMNDLFLPKLPAYPLVGGRLSTASCKLTESPLNAHTQDDNLVDHLAPDRTCSRSSPLCSSHESASRSLSRPCTRDPAHSSSTAAGFGFGAGASIAGHGASVSKSPPLPRDEVLEAFLWHLERTESIERRALQASLREWQAQVKQHMAWFTLTVRAAQSVPPLFVPLLASMSEEWGVCRAARLFCEEQAGRMKIIRHYNSTPLHFLNRPLLNFSAEERRRRLVEWMPTDSKEMTFISGTSASSERHNSQVKPATLDRTNQEDAEEQDRVDRSKGYFHVGYGQSQESSYQSLRYSAMLPITPDIEARGHLACSPSSKRESLSLVSIDQSRGNEPSSANLAIPCTTPPRRILNTSFDSALKPTLLQPSFKPGGRRATSPLRRTPGRIGASWNALDHCAPASTTPVGSSPAAFTSESPPTPPDLSPERLPIPLLRGARHDRPPQPRAPQPVEPEAREELFSSETGLNFVLDKQTLFPPPESVSSTAEQERREKTFRSTTLHPKETEGIADEFSTHLRKNRISFLRNYKLKGGTTRAQPKEKPCMPTKLPPVITHGM